MNRTKLFEGLEYKLVDGIETEIDYLLEEVKTRGITTAFKTIHNYNIYEITLSGNITNSKVFLDIVTNFSVFLSYLPRCYIDFKPESATFITASEKIGHAIRIDFKFIYTLG